ncbi:hypothetical protein O181_019286 [Austropuccinia psidii MF-1]|uniref:MI domain-containing protein n=1 Tax=Austropuccinia psidii MF-1 TaxID=1389203 RepID=A0A9Q3CB84_9BASI|nr:hypothetical protein [Austropuccinia psidii MF-1]
MEEWLIINQLPSPKLPKDFPNQPCHDQLISVPEHQNSGPSQQTLPHKSSTKTQFTSQMTLQDSSITLGIKSDLLMSFKSPEIFILNQLYSLGNLHPSINFFKIFLILSSGRFKPRRVLMKSKLKRNHLSLPAKLATELTALGHTVKSNHHPNSLKRKKLDESSNENFRKLQSTIKSHSNSKLNLNFSSKKQKLNHPSSLFHNQNQLPKQKVKTDLENLLQKQGYQSAPVKQYKTKTKEEEIEDKQIAWLETELGIKTGKNSKLKLRQEFQDDGLEDLFDDLDKLDQLVEDLTTLSPTHNKSSKSPDFSLKLDPNKSSKFDDSPQSESSWSGCSSDNDKHHPEISNSQSLSSKEPTQDPPSTNQQVSQIISSDNLNTSTRYLPPHLRPKSSNPSSETIQLVEPSLDPRLRRQLMGILNRVSPTSLPVCLESLRELYINHPRAIISHGLSDIILDLISSKDLLGSALLVTYAALVSAISRGGVQVSGVEIGWAATFIAKLTLKISTIYHQTHIDNDILGKTGTNLLGFLSHLYFFQVTHCTLVYDVIRFLIEHNLDEYRVEGLIVLLKASGPRLRHDDPTALKEIVLLVQKKRTELSETSSRIKFMLETLNDLKNNKIRKQVQSITGTIEETQENLKKYLGALSKKSNLEPEPIQLTLKDLQEASQKGKWWLIGAAWDGNPLVDSVATTSSNQKSNEPQTNFSEGSLLNLARKQGMNTDIRRAIFNAIMTAEDYVDATDKINQLGLTSVQQREIVRVLLHCLGKEKLYNPYYTMVGQKLAAESHSIKITMQFLLWDFFRELGETEVGGKEMLKSLSVDQDENVAIDLKRMKHIASAYGWWIAKGGLTIHVLKPLPFDSLRPKTVEFISLLLNCVFISTQASSPTLAPSTLAFKKDSVALQSIFQKALSAPALAQGLATFLESSWQKKPDSDKSNNDFLKSENASNVINWARDIVIDLLSNGI